MNKIFLALGLFALTFSLADAQRGQRSEQRADIQQRIEQRLQQLSQQLDLSNEQITHLRDFAQTEGRALREQMQATTSRSEKRELAQSYTQAFQAEVDATLTEAQKAELEQIKEDRQAEAQVRREQVRDNAQERLTEMVEELDLTEDQRNRLNTFVEGQRVAREEEMAATESRQDKVAIARRYAEAFKTELDNVLTDEQKAQLEEMKQEARSNRESNGRRGRGLRRGRN
ncbi:MAG: hypothetical protein AAF741_05110 [Bacteroidota bacterium]